MLGLVFWDTFRTEYMGVKEVFEKLWTPYYWCWDDPRRNLDSAGRVIPGSDDDLHTEEIVPVRGSRFPIYGVKF